MGAASSGMDQLVYRVWHFNGHTLELLHDYAFQNLLLDGEYIFQSTKSAMDGAPDSVVEQEVDGQRLCVGIIAMGSQLNVAGRTFKTGWRYDYNVSFAGKALASHVNRSDEDKVRLTCKVVRVVVGKGHGGTGASGPNEQGIVVRFVIEATCTNTVTGEVIASSSVPRRFREFYRLNEIILPAFRGTHLYANVPAMPWRGTPWQDHQDPKFLAARRDGLHLYCSRLAALPRAAHLNELLRFLKLPVAKIRSLIQQNVRIPVPKRPAKKSIQEAAQAAEAGGGEAASEAKTTVVAPLQDIDETPAARPRESLPILPLTPKPSVPGVKKKKIPAGVAKPTVPPKLPTAEADAGGGGDEFARLKLEKPASPKPPVVPKTSTPPAAAAAAAAAVAE